MSVRIINADVLDGLSQLEADSVNCVVTSPPYWGLRDYGTEGQIGLEPTPAEYVAKMVAVFREIRRVLRKDGTCWLNLGDSYATGAGKVGKCPGGGDQGGRWTGKHDYGPMGPTTQPNRMPQEGPKPKDLVGIPWRVAFALQADGWWLRQDIIWSKRNPMPESVTDRCTKAHEYLFHLTKSERYYYDAEAIAEPVTDSTIARISQPNLENQVGSDRVPGKTNGTMKAVIRQGKNESAGVHRRQNGFNARWNDSEADGTAPLTRNKRSVWEINTQPFPDAHFATFPTELPENCIKAGCPEGGTVLDPFFGAGTTGLVADRLGRNCIGIELNPEYAALAERRIKGDCPLFSEVSGEAQEQHPVTRASS